MPARKPVNLIENALRPHVAHLASVCADAAKLRGAKTTAVSFRIERLPKAPAGPSQNTEFMAGFLVPHPLDAVNQAGREARGAPPGTHRFQHANGASILVKGREARREGTNVSFIGFRFNVSHGDASEGEKAVADVKAALAGLAAREAKARMWALGTSAESVRDAAKNAGGRI